MKLNYKEYGSGSPLLILHGLMGSLDNWHTLATRFGAHNKIYAIDQRNHGKSPHSSEHSIALMVSDLVEFIGELKLDKVSIIGHSMGGKVAMQFALEHGEKVNDLIVVDMAPREYKRGHDAIFKALFSVDLTTVTSRKEVEQIMGELISDNSTLQFLLKNLERNADGSYQWKMNIQALYDNYDDMIAKPESNGTFNRRTLFIRGGNSRYIDDSDLPGIKKLFPAYELVTIGNAGHWVHADQPQLLYDAVTKFLSRNG